MGFYGVKIKKPYFYTVKKHSVNLRNERNLENTSDTKVKKVTQDSTFLDCSQQLDCVFFTNCGFMCTS